MGSFFMPAKRPLKTRPCSKSQGIGSEVCSKSQMACCISQVPCCISQEVCSISQASLVFLGFFRNPKNESTLAWRLVGVR